ncbi:MAG TPA: hemerythrin [Geobacter sp.]|nr:hemerythrin [Geobacter sp.]
MLTTWREEMATGNDVIDGQHKELLRRVAEMLKCAKEQRGHEELGRLMWFLKKYVRQHFRAEEKLQLDCGFPGYEAHKLQHELFFREVLRLERMYEEQGDNTVMIVAAITAMCEWLRSHFNVTDKIMAEYLRENGAETIDN